MSMTRDEHMKWCKERAIREYDYYAKADPKNAIKNGVVSIMSDIRKHPETNSESLQTLCAMMLMGKQINNRQQFVDFINGFN